ncbi:MAG: hypothetical protein HUU55_09225 [Myxococcales bacterium]|nr:hypothetical protein [Myxococcales bacterium]
MRVAACYLIVVCTYVNATELCSKSWGNITGQEEVLGIGFKLLVPIAETEPVQVCFITGVVDAPSMIPIAFPWVNLDHVFVWSTVSCGCSACD